MDADITAEILRSIRDELRSTRNELKADIAGVRHELDELRTEMRAGFADVRTELGVLQLRVGTVERVLVSLAHELRDVATRVTRLEERDPTPA